MQTPDEDPRAKRPHSTPFKVYRDRALTRSGAESGPTLVSHDTHSRVPRHPLSSPTTPTLVSHDTRVTALSLRRGVGVQLRTTVKVSKLVPEALYDTLHGRPASRTGPPYPREGGFGSDEQSVSGDPLQPRVQVCTGAL